jgi:hypothetical protein
MASLSQVSIEIGVTGERQATQALRNLDNSIVKNIQTAQRLERGYALLDKAFNNGKISAQMYAKGVQQLDRAVEQAYKGQFQLEKQVSRTTRAIKAQNDANHFASRRMNATGMAVQQAGYQVGDFLVQVQSGTNAFVAFGQQATQLVGILPLMADSLGVSAGKLILISSVLGVAIPLFTAFAAAISRTGGAGEIFEDLAFAIEPIKPLIDVIANAMSIVANTAIDFVNILVNNLDRIVVAATVVTGFLAAKWVASFISAGKATTALTVALGYLRATLMRLPFVGLVVLATEAIIQFSNLVKATGSLGEAFSTLGEIASEIFTFESVTNGLLALNAKASEIILSMTATFMQFGVDVVSYLGRPFNVIGAVVMGVIEGVKSVFDTLPAFIENVGISAANFFIGGMEKLANGAVKAVNKVISAFNKVLDWVGADKFAELFGFSGQVGEIEEIELGRFELSKQAQEAGEAFTEGFNRGYDESLIETPVVDTLQKIVDETRSTSDAMGELADAYGENFMAANPALEELIKKLKEADAAGREINVRDWFGGIGSEDGEKSGTGGKGAADRTKDALTELQERVQSVADTIKNSMSEAFMSIVEGTKSAKDAFRDMARAIIKQLFDVLVVQQLVGSFDVATGKGSGIVGAIMGVFQADGGVWRNGSQVEAFANGGVVSGPTLFPMANGKTGLMGEAGPEAIMPLKRGKGGKLGVVADGASQPIVINQSFNFSANGDESVKRIIAQEAPKIANLTQKQIIEQRQRGGTMKSVFS